MKTRMMAIVMVISMLAVAQRAWAAGAEAGAAQAFAAATPVLPDAGGHWAGVVLIIIGGMFLAAAVIGPVIRAELPEELPPAHSHDEPPGTSGHHGPGGTLNAEENSHTHEHRPGSH